MRAIYDNVVIQIEITNACHLSCANCTRHVGHHRKPFFMNLDTVKKAILSLEEFPGRIGIMGGEPTMHPKFEEITALYREMVPDRRRREFWSAGFGWMKYKTAILETWDRERISYNDHIAYDGKHQPLLVAIDEVIDDPEWRAELIDNCKFGNRWSASITPKGGFFCEIAASADWLFDGPGGYPIEPGWWRKNDTQFADQVERYCGKCSGAIPLPAFSDGRGGRDGPTVDLVSPGNLERLLAVGSPKAASGHYQVFDKKITREDAAREKIDGWNPTNYRSFHAHGPDDVDRNLGTTPKIGAPPAETIASRFKPAAIVQKEAAH